MKPALAPILALLFSLAALAPATHARSADQNPELLARATEEFRAATAAMESDRPAALRRLDTAIALFEQLEQNGVRNGGLLYNLANAHLLKGDVGRAILNYRRAQLLTPSDPNLAANLAEARRRVQTLVQPSGTSRARAVLLFWHDELAPSARLSIMLVAWTLAWSCALARLTGAWRSGSLAIAALGALLACTMLGSLVVSARQTESTAAAVVIAPQAVGRKGPDLTVYQPTFSEPLHAGVELRVIEQRPGWILARLADGRETWLEASAVGLVTPN
ncbi:MAG: hypothetical protein SFZ24_03290 [Planctomycetota bacterium]|nr:hypothetical protein [Planctomycetota bacterium]